MEYEIRTIAGDELEAFRRCQSLAFGYDFDADRSEAGRPLFEFDRNLAAVVDGEIVGTAGALSTQMSVPGGSVPIAAVTMVSVKPTHRRQGIVTGIMRRQLEQVRQRGEPVATLWASESSIYGRFGYGIAIQMESLSIPRVWATLRDDIPAPRGSVRLIAVDEAKRTLPELHERLRKVTPGELARWPQWWDIRVFTDRKEDRDGFTESNYAVYEGPDGLDGYVKYRVKADWTDWLANGTVRIVEFFANTPEAQVGLWRYLLGIDLVGSLEKETGEMDEPLLWMLRDSRRVERKRLDAIWLRVLDVEKALSSRKLNVDGRVTFAVHDAFLDGTGGTFQLEGGPDGATCRRVEATPEFETGIEELGAAYLGGARLASFRRAGRVTGDERAIARADAMLSWSRLPHCQEHY